jgi:hypothetical protein
MNSSSVRVAYTTSVGKFISRTNPYIGWAMVLYDVLSIISQSQNEFESLPSKQNLNGDKLPGAKGSIGATISINGPWRDIKPRPILIP